MYEGLTVHYCSNSGVWQVDLDGLCALGEFDSQEPQGAGRCTHHLIKGKPRVTS